MDPDGREGREELGGVGGGYSVIRIQPESFARAQNAVLIIE